MPSQKSPRLKELPLVFKALSDPTRLRLLNLLSEREVCVCHLCDVLKLVQPKISRHLAYLKKASLVVARREGIWIHYSWAAHSDTVTRSMMDGLRDWMAKDEAMTKERTALKHVCC